MRRINTDCGGRFSIGRIGIHSRILRPFGVLGLQLLLLSTTGLGQTPIPPPTGDDVLVITLRPTTTTRETVIPVSAVATLRGGPTSLRKKVANLDLAELKPNTNAVAVGSDQVSFRLQLAGIEPARFRIEGKQAFIGFAADDVTEEALVAAAVKAVKLRLPKFADNVSIVAVPPVQVPRVDVEASDKIRLEARPAPSLNPLGLIEVPVDVIKNGVCCATASIYLNVSYIARSSAAEIEREADNPILVKSHDSVRLVARVGAIRVVALGEALQEGRRGELIRVRNVDSSKIVAGRVSEAQVVEVEY